MSRRPRGYRDCDRDHGEELTMARPVRTTSKALWQGVYMGVISWIVFRFLDELFDEDT